MFLVGDVRLDYAVPPSDLTAYVTLFYDFSADVPLFEDVERANHAQLRFLLKHGDARYGFPDATEQAAAETHILGPTSGAVRIYCAGPVEVFGFGLTSAGWAAMIGTDVSLMLNRVLDARDVFDADRVQAVIAALRAAPGTDARVAIGEALVRDLLQTVAVGAARFVRDVDAWLAASASPAMDDLIAVTALSRRQVERKCKALYGAPPKLLARKYRALRAAVALVAGTETPVAAIARGFYDHSHMIREIKHFTGLTPRQIHADPGVLAHLTITRRMALEGQISPLISGT